MTVVAATDSYADVSMYRLALDKQDEGADEDIERDLATVSRFLDNKLGRFFGQEDLTASGAIYPLAEDADNAIDDFVSVSQVALDLDGDSVFERVLNMTEYQLLPRNAPLGSEPRPYTRLRVLPVFLSTGAWGPFYNEPQLRIRGVRGWPNVPSALVSATIQYTALWRMDSPRATTQVTELGTTSGTSRQAQSIINEIPAYYRKRWFIA